MSSTEADIVIVGGGTAGLVLANRLSEDSGLQVLVLEAGQDMRQDPRVTTPALWSGLVSSDADWGFVTEPQEALYGKQINLPQGRLLGGTSALNGMAFIANAKANVDAWSQLGNPGWDWETLKPYYQKTYKLNLPSKEQQERLALQYVDQSETHASTGPIQASFPDAIDDPIADAWIQSFQKNEAANLMATDPFSGQAHGGYINAASIDPITKTRSYAANAYYEPVQERKNLQIVTEAAVKKLLLSPSGPDGEVIATGVQYQRDGSTHSVTARHEVILSAGVFNSPKILELSGIGSRAILEKYDIPVLVDNANVGENLQDHVIAGVSLEVQESIPTKDDLVRRDPAVIQAAMQEYMTRQSGPFTVGGNFASALLPLPPDSPEDDSELTSILESVSSSLSESSSPETDFKSHVLSIIKNPQEATGGYFIYPTQSNFMESHKKGMGIQTPLPGNHLTMVVQLLHPFSRGHSHITSANAADTPAVNPRYLTHPLDVEILARHTRFIENIAASPSLASVLKPNGKRSVGAFNDFRAVPLAEVKEYVRKAAKSAFHPMGTCSMLPREKGGVVDSRLRVWGVQGLRVVDASVIPFITRANSQSTVYAIAERAADLIKEDIELRAR